MILTCPACSTRYTVDAAKFPAAGRTVRCAKCGHSWHQPGEAPEQDDIIEALPAHPRPPATFGVEAGNDLRGAALPADDVASIAAPFAPESMSKRSIVDDKPS